MDYSKLIRKLETEIEGPSISLDLVEKCQAADDISARGMAYQVLTEPHLRTQIHRFKPKADYPIACLEYLLDCISLDLDWDEDYAHCPEDAIWELSGVLDPYWEKANPIYEASAFWNRISMYLSRDSAKYNELFVTDFLMLCDRNDVFQQTMIDWRTNERLRVYVDAYDTMMKNKDG